MSDWIRNMQAQANAQAAATIKRANEGAAAAMNKTNALAAEGIAKAKMVEEKLKVAKCNADYLKNMKPEAADQLVTCIRAVIAKPS